MVTTKTRLICCWFVAASMVGAGCNRSEDISEPAPAPPPAPVSQSAPAAQPPALPPGHPDISGMSAQSLPAGATSDMPNPQWTVPEGWQPGNAAPMRRATYLVKGADGQAAEVVVSVFPGDVGGLMANINRWRAQIGMGPIAPDEIAGVTSDTDVDGMKATIVDLKANIAPAGKAQPPRMIVVTVPHAGSSWFFKMTGDAPLVETQKQTFLQFAKSVRF